MKRRLAIVTDSTVYLTERLRANPDLYVMPIVIISEGREYEDGKGLTTEKLYDIIRNKDVPTTSQPSVGSFKELYEKLKEDYEEILAVHVSSKLSGTMASSIAGMQEAGVTGEAVDSLSLSFAITDLIEKGQTLSNQGTGVKEIAARLREEATGARNLIVPGKLDQLYKGGRMSGTSYMLGNLLKIMPILMINQEGELGLLERVRAEKKAIGKLVSAVKKSCETSIVDQVGIMHGNAEVKANELSQRLREEIPGLHTVIGEISSSLAVHAGEDTIGIFWNEG